jgi:hypothetical protein
MTTPTSATPRPTSASTSSSATCATRGYDVLYVQNITDVGHMLDTGEDRILRKARQISAKPMQVVETYARLLRRHGRPGRAPPDISPRASGHIPEQIAMIEGSSRRATPMSATVRSTSTSPRFPEYGKLSGRVIEDLRRGRARRRAQEKRHPADFALWKKAEPEHILRWPSPWGDGLSRLAHRMLGDGRQVPGRDVRHSRRRHRQTSSPQRMRNRPERSRPRRAIRPLLDADRLADARRRQDEQESGQHVDHQERPGADGGRKPSAPSSCPATTAARSTFPTRRSTRPIRGGSASGARSV